MNLSYMLKLYLQLNCFGRGISVLKINCLFVNCFIWTQIRKIVNNLNHTPSIIIMRVFQIYFTLFFNLQYISFYLCCVGWEACQQYKSEITKWKYWKVVEKCYKFKELGNQSFWIYDFFPLQVSQKLLAYYSYERCKNKTTQWHQVCFSWMQFISKITEKYEMLSCND